MNSLIKLMMIVAWGKLYWCDCDGPYCLLSRWLHTTGERQTIPITRKQLTKEEQEEAAVWLDVIEEMS